MYGLTDQDIVYINQKIKNQKKYLEDNYFSTSSGQIKTLLDVSYSANHSQRYYAQLSNKINTMSEYAHHFDLKPVFMTITLDGFFRDFLKGDFRRFNKRKNDKKIKILKSIPNNEVYGFLQDKIKNEISFTIKDLYNVLNFQFKKFLSSYPFKKMLKEGLKYIYIRTVEPHKLDGVPHFHLMFYIPSHYEQSIKDAFVTYCPAPRNAKHGFITDIKNPVGYILKYITKSFIDVKNQNDLDYIQCWYIKHRIMRCVTSRFTVPQWVYQKCYAIENNWHYLTDFIYDENKICEWDFNRKYFHFHDLNSSREIRYEDGVISLIRDDRIIQTFGEKKEKVVIKSSVPKKFVSFKTAKSSQIDLYIDGEKYFYNEAYYGYCKKIEKKPYEMSDLELYEYFENLDIDKVEYPFYLHTRNMMIDRGLLDAEKTSLLEDDFLGEFAETTEELLIRALMPEAEEVF